MTFLCFSIMVFATCLLFLSCRGQWLAEVEHVYGYTHGKVEHMQDMRHPPELSPCNLEQATGTSQNQYSRCQPRIECKALLIRQRIIIMLLQSFVSAPPSLSFSMAFSSHLHNNHKLLVCSNLTDRMLAVLFCLSNEHHQVLLGLKSSVSPSLKFLYVLSFVTCPLFREGQHLTFCAFKLLYRIFQKTSRMLLVSLSGLSDSKEQNPATFQRNVHRYAKIHVCAYMYFN